MEGLAKGVFMILGSELGDKTFFIAALMAMRHPRRLVLAGALGALWMMTMLSAFVGWLAPNLIPHTWTHVGATLLFFVFGIRSLWDGFMEEGGMAKELQEVEKQLGGEGDKKEEGNGKEGKKKKDPKDEKKRRQFLTRFISPILLETFSLTFFGEWGDKSQIATVTLAAEESALGVTIGGMIGHAVCTGLAVMGGKAFAARISEKTVTLFGGLLFCLFGLQSLLSGPEK